jgi:hypothetical protein
MKKKILTIIITSILSSTNVVAEKIDYTQFKKISEKYLECTTTNLKEKSKKIKLKVTAGAEELKKKVTKNTTDSKKKIGKFALKEKLIKFKNSKTLTEFMEK